MNQKYPCYCGSSLMFTGVTDQNGAGAYLCERKACHSSSNKMYLAPDLEMPKEGDSIRSAFKGEQKEKFFLNGRYVSATAYRSYFIKKQPTP